MRNLEKMNNVVLKGDMEEASYKTQILLNMLIILLLKPYRQSLMKMMYWIVLW